MKYNNESKSLRDKNRHWPISFHAAASPPVYSHKLQFSHTPKGHIYQLGPHFDMDECWQETPAGSAEEDQAAGPERLEAEEERRAGQAAATQAVR